MDSLILSQQRNSKHFNSNISLLSTISKPSVLKFPQILPQPCFQQNINHTHCSCYHCINNTIPLPTQFYPIIHSSQQYSLQSNQAYTFILQHLIDFVGNLNVPDTFIADDGSYIFKNGKSKIKSKINQTPTDIKKNFDIKKVLYQKIFKNNQDNKIKINKTSLTKKSLITNNNNNSNNNNNNNNSINSINTFNNNISNSINNNNNNNNNNNQQSFIISPQLTLSKPVIKQPSSLSMKQVSLIHYKNNFSQLVTQSLLFKLLSKRKNDIFWQQITSISLIPPYKQKQIYYHQYKYERNKKTIKQIEIVMKKVAEQIDRQEIYEDNNPQNDIIRQKVWQNKQNNNLNNTLKSYSSSSLSSQVTQQRLISTLSHQIISFLQLKHHIRIITCTFCFIIDNEFTCYLMSVSNFTYSILSPYQITSNHDRLTLLQPIKTQQLIKIKSLNIQKQYQQLIKLIAQLMIDCLQNRMLQLDKNKMQYKRPDKNTLVKIFKKLVPTFDQQEVFKNKNWKNQFHSNIFNYKNKINQLIRNDGGIRILKRFNITFYRTWN